MKFLQIVAAFSLSLFFMLLISPLRSSYGGGFPVSSLVGFTGYFYITLFLISKYGRTLSDWQIIISLFSGLWMLVLPIRVIDFYGTLGSLPDTLIHTLGIICGFFYLRLKSPLNVLTTFLGCLLAIFMFFEGYDYWLHKLNFGTFTGRIEAHNLPAKFEAFDERQNPVAEGNFQNKIVLLDFWTTTCGICFKKFPQVQTVYDKYKSDSSVMILAVNNPIEEDKPNQAFDDVRKEGHSFPVVVTKDEDLAEKFGVKGYPTTFVINRNGQIVYKGDIEGAVRMVDELKESR